MEACREAKTSDGLSKLTAWNDSGFVLMTVTETAMEQHQPVDTSKVCPLFTPVLASISDSFEESHTKSSGEVMPRATVTSGARWIFPDVHHLLHPLFSTEVNQLAGNIGERDTKKCAWL